MNGDRRRARIPGSFGSRLMLAQAIVKAGLRNVAAGANPIALGAGISKAADAVSEALLAAATPDDFFDDYGFAAGPAAPLSLRSRDPNFPHSR